MAGKELLQVLLDEGSMLELDAHHRCGVLTGLCTVQSRPLGVMLCEKGASDVKAFDRALRLLDKTLCVGAPLLMVFDDGEELGDRGGIWRFVSKLVRLSGVCPILTLMIGSAGPLAKAAASYADFCIRTGFASPVAGCTLMHCADLPAAVEKIRTLVSLLPSNCAEEAPLLDIGDEMNRLCEAPSNAAAHTLAKHLSDRGSKCILYEDQHALALFARIGGRLTGVVAAADDMLPADVSRFVRFCDCFSIPVVWIEDGALPMHPQLTYALAEATVPKVMIPLGEKEEAGAMFDITIAPQEAAPGICADDRADITEMRRLLINALEMLSAKRDILPPHKHGNLPLGGILL